MRISGGLLFDYEIKNRYQVDVRLYPKGSCADDPEYGALSQGERYTGQLENNKFSLGFEFGIGYSFMLRQKFTIVPNLNYNMIFVKEKFQTTSDWYLNKQHGIGVGCKVFFKTKKPS